MFKLRKLLGLLPALIMAACGSGLSNDPLDPELIFDQQEITITFSPEDAAHLQWDLLFFEQDRAVLTSERRDLGFDLAFMSTRPFHEGDFVLELYELDGAALATPHVRLGEGGYFYAAIAMDGAAQVMRMAMEHPARTNPRGRTPETVGVLELRDGDAGEIFFDIFEGRLASWWIGETPRQVNINNAPVTAYVPPTLFEHSIFLNLLANLPEEFAQPGRLRHIPNYAEFLEAWPGPFFFWDSLEGHKIFMTDGANYVTTIRLEIPFDRLDEGLLLQDRPTAVHRDSAGNLLIQIHVCPDKDAAALQEDTVVGHSTVFKINFDSIR